SLEPLQHIPRPLVANVAGVQRVRRLEQHHLDLLIGHRPVLNLPRHDDELPLLDPHRPVAILHAEATLHDLETLVFVVVMVPDERPEELHELHLLTIQLTDDFGLPVRPDACELLGEIDRLGHDRFSSDSTVPRGTARSVPPTRSRTTAVPAVRSS